MSVRVPKYRLHKGSGQALVEIDGRRIYLGKHNSTESREQYRRLIAAMMSPSKAVLKAAERYFAAFTHGSYSEIRHSPDGQEVVVLSPNGATKTVEQLSRGTAEQLYLALRFGFVNEFVRRSESLPLVFDDILVNFDPGRARATAEAIVDLAKSQQILFFTCQPSTVALIQDVDGNVPVYALHNGGFRKY